MLISIIVPVYNTEAFLERCLQSLLRQGLAEDEFEIILVNDGSTDGSLQICEKYSKIHDNIRIISQANGGIGAARNTGMSLARGEYVCFVDSDDDLSENGLSEMITYCDSEVDAIRFWCRIVHPHTKDENVKEDGRELFRGRGHDYLKKFGLETFCWNWLYRRDYLLSNKLFFKKIIGEDFQFMSEVLLSNPIVVSLAARIYNYEIREDSTSSTRSIGHSRRWVEDLLSTLSDIVSRLNNYQETDSALYETCMKSIDGKMIALSSRLMSADYSLSEYKEKVERCKKLGVLPLKNMTGSVKQRIVTSVTNTLYEYPSTYLFAKNFYNRLFITYIKPYINRNKL